VSANANTFGNNIIIVAGNTSIISIGDIVSGSNLAPNTVVTGFNSPPSGRSNITISNAAAGSNTNTAVSFYSSTKVVSPGIAGPGLCKAWVNFDGTGSVQIRAAYNVNSITDNGTGDYTVNFTNAFVDANYSVTAALGGSTILGADLTLTGTTAPTTSAIRIGTRRTTDGTLLDTTYVDVAVFR
jgi:hypothetical protein